MTVNIAKSLASTVKLNDGVVMPLFGLGCFKQEEAAVSAKVALSAGYHLLDTAIYYDNEAGVGEAVKASKLKRDEIFIVSKLWNDYHGYDRGLEAVKGSLKRLGTDYIDLYLIHSPFGGKLVETYDALLHLKSQGLIRSVGVSNFGVAHLEGLHAAGRPLPSVNQIELHPWSPRTELVTWCRQHGVTVMGYSPLVKGQKFDDPHIFHMSKKYGKTPAQVLIRWSVQKGFITIPKSDKRDRIIANADVFDFSIDDKDMNILERVPNYICSWNPTIEPWEG